MYGPRGAGSSRSSDDLHNEDAFLVEDEIGLYAVCDGRGDAPGGEVAAYLAIDAVSRYLDGLLRFEGGKSGGRLAATLPADVSCRTVEAAVRYALETILERTSDRPDLEGMATTVTVVLVQRGRAFVGHFGDSRAYLVRGDDLVQLTTDHEWTETESVRSGASRSGIDTFSIETRVGDTFILCTDGAEGEVVIGDLLEAIHGYSPRLIASRLVAAAQRHRPDEDATVVVVRIRDDLEFARIGSTGPVGLDGYARARVHRPYARASRPAAPFENLMDRTAISNAPTPSRRNETA
ncbi:MAG: protein phosphatase 2C domain-containing protein [bacterium]|nr:protein phosphatase 2C domain-containing protein [bacterium]